MLFRSPWPGLSVIDPSSFLSITDGMGSRRRLHNASRSHACVGCAQLLVITRDVVISPGSIAGRQRPHAFCGHRRCRIQSRWMVPGRRPPLCNSDPWSSEAAALCGLRLSVAARRCVDLLFDQSGWFIIIHQSPPAAAL